MNDTDETVETVNPYADLEAATLRNLAGEPCKPGVYNLNVTLPESGGDEFPVGRELIVDHSGSLRSGCDNG